ncbi:MAG: tetratricopeptide repeat protein [Phycisphaerae bacterium]
MMSSIPRKFKKEEIVFVPISWRETIDKYPSYRKKAIKENEPGFYTLIVILSTAIVRRNTELVYESIKLTKKNVPEHIYLSLAGSALCDLGFKDEGLTMLRKSIEHEKSSTLLLGLAAETDNPEEAQNLSEMVLRNNPQDCDALRHLAFAKYSKGEKDEAEEILDKVLKIEPTNKFALENKGNSCFNRKEYDKALETYLKIDLNPTPVSLQYKICCCYYKLGCLKKAKKIAKKIKDKVSLSYDFDDDTENARNLLQEISSS